MFFGLILVLGIVRIPELFYLYGFILFHLDLLGISLLGASNVIYSLQEPDNKYYYIFGGVCILSWVFCRIFSQYVIPGIINRRDFLNLLFSLFGLGGIEDLNVSVPSPLVMFTFIFGGLVLCVGSTLLWRGQRERFSVLFMIYGILNLLAVILLFPLPSILAGKSSSIWFYETLLGKVMKLVFIPLLGIIVYFNMLNQDPRITLK
jgi:hypothetical protein